MKKYTSSLIFWGGLLNFPEIYDVVDVIRQTTESYCGTFTMPVR